MKEEIKYKLSHYIIVTDSLLNSQKRLLLATRTAKIIPISNLLYERLLTGRWSEISDDVISKLINIKAIVPEHEDELQAIIAANNASIKSSTTLYHVIQPTAMCQLGCGYCGQTHTKNYLSDDASKNILERIEGKFLNNKFNHVSIAWFGAEPLVGLSQMRYLSPKLHEIAKKNNCEYSSLVVTNGLSLKEHVFLELVKKHYVKSIEVTLDGTADYHDARRHTKAGLSSFNLIMKNLLKILNRSDFKELGCKISIRCNVDERNEEGVIPLIKLLSSYDLQDKIANFYVARVHSWGNDAHLLSHEKEEFAEKEIDWILEQYKYGFKPNLLPGLQPIVCMSVNPNAEVFDAFGNVFDCTETPYVDTYSNTDYILGNVNNGLSTISTKRPLINFYEEIYNGDYQCSTCKMLPVCGGGCPKSWKDDIIACPSNKFNVKDKLILAYAISKGGIDVLNDN